jgi:hypothetical protein
MEIAAIIPEYEPQDHWERAFQNVLKQIGRPNLLKAQPPF